MDDEILVHISAPATRQNDELYRTLADAYLNFEPYKPEPESSRKKTRKKNSDHGRLPHSELRVSTGSLQKPVASPNKDGISSPLIHDIPASQHEELSGSVEESLNDSMHDSALDASRIGQLEKIHRHWRTDRDVKATSAGEPRSSPRSTARSLCDQSTFIEDTQMADLILQSQLIDEVFGIPSENVARSVVPSTKVVKTPPPLLKPVSSPSESRQEVTSSWGSSLVTSTGAREPSQPFKTKVVETVALHSHHQTNGQRSVSQATDDIALSYDFIALPIEVFAPAPKTSVEVHGALPSQITKYLSTVKQQNPNCFTPSKRTRDLESDERGCWVVNCSKWSQIAQLDFWSSLCEHVRTGRLGWGITLHREGASPESLGEIRLYCWGEIVEHIWLSMWLCSEGRIIGTGSRWLDAGDIMVVEIH